MYSIYIEVHLTAADMTKIIIIIIIVNHKSENHKIFHALPNQPAIYQGFKKPKLNDKPAEEFLWEYTVCW